MRTFIRGLMAVALLGALPLAANAEVVISVGIAPPVMPVYAQPPMPGDGYLWTPGYWAWNGAGYYWVPGVWTLAPAPGMLWTPGYWGWVGGAYVWHAGYWGPHVGFYGGINYGYGYSGVGFHGGSWVGGRFVVDPVVVHEAPVNHVAFNGGAGGIVARPTSAEMIAARDRHMGFTPSQVQHEQMAAHNPSMRSEVMAHGAEHGTPGYHGAPPQAYHNPGGAPHQPGPQEQHGGGGYGHEGHGEPHEEHLR
jgi:hypothetical protein